MATWLGGAVLGVTLVGCTIEGTRQRGDECLQDRECVSPLRCEVTPDGRWNFEQISGLYPISKDEGLHEGKEILGACLDQYKKMVAKHV